VGGSIYNILMFVFFCSSNRFGKCFSAANAMFLLHAAVHCIPVSGLEMKMRC